MSRLRRWAHAIKLDVHALYLAARDPWVPWYAKAVAVGVAAYALSPIDLIPVFVRILGCVDDLFIVPLGIVLAIKLIPAEIMAEYRRTAAREQVQPQSRAGAVAVNVVWIIVSILADAYIYRLAGE